MNPAIDQLINLQLQRLAWLEPAASQVRKWRAEDERNGITWQSQRERGRGNASPSEIMAEHEYEAWRPALLAFYRADCWFQSAQNLERGAELSPQDKRLIECLAKAFAARPRTKLKIAA